jgi:hypothetical protein
MDTIILDLKRPEGMVGHPDAAPRDGMHGAFMLLPSFMWPPKETFWLNLGL